MGPAHSRDHDEPQEPHGTGRASGSRGAAEAGAQRELPAHIAAQLRSAGGSADTGGQPWQGRDLAHGHRHRFSGDEGRPDPALERALSDRLAGAADEADVVAALAGARVFVPVMAEVSASTITDDGLVADKEADMALVTLQSRSGRKAQPVFSSDSAVGRWHDGARPVAADARRVALAAVKDGAQLLVLDPGSQAPFVVRRPALWAIAQGRVWTPSYRSDEVSRAVLDAALGLPGVAGAHVRRGRGADAPLDRGSSVPGGGEGPELTAVLELLPGLDRSQLESLVGAFQTELSQHAVVAEQVDSLEVSLETLAV
ncbi:SseB family protein [Kocuria palustris]|uniref:SseB family protein n=1 Tax=Kocuria palustris TaxID=71999 RepID=UPI0011A74A60|nr:SseB family protein [Kocuria palustris]